MFYHLFGFSRPIDREWLTENKMRKLRFARAAFREEDRRVVEVFVRFLLMESEPDKVIAPESLTNLSADPLLIPKLCSLGLVVVEGSELHLGWRNEVAAFTLAKYFASVIEDGSLHIQDAMPIAEKLDRTFQAHLFIPLKLALAVKKLKPDVVEFLREEVKSMFHSQLYTGHVLNGSASDPEYQWNQQLRITEREHPFRSSEEQRRFTFYLELLNHLQPDFAQEMIGFAQTPIQFLILQRRMDVTSASYFQEPRRSHASSFLVFAIHTHLQEEYGRWVHEAGAWRTAVGDEKKGLLTPLELLREKAKLDENAIALARRYIDSLPSPLTAQHVHAALYFVDELLGSMRMQWQTSRNDTDGLRAPLIDSVARLLSARIADEMDAISSGLSAYLSKERFMIDDRFSIVSELGLSLDCKDGLKALLRDALLQRTDSFLSNPFAAYPHFPQKNRFERNFGKFRQFLFEDEAARRQYFTLLRGACSALIVPPERDANQDFNRNENCAYFVRIALLGDISQFPVEEHDDTIKILKQCYTERLKTAPPFGAAQGLIAELVRHKIISLDEVEKSGRWSDEEVRQMAPDRRRYYSRHLIDEGEYAEAKRILKESEEEAWTKGGNSRGQTSEGIYNLMLLLYLDRNSTQEEYANAVQIFERNRECVGSDPESAYTLASVMAERSGQFEKALQFIDRAALVNPGNLDHWLNKIVILLKAQDGIGAHKLSEEIPAIYHSVDRVAHLRLAAHVSAIEHLPRQVSALADRLLEKNVDDYDALYNKAVAHTYSGQFGQAVATCRSILEKNPGEQQTLKLLSSLESKTKSQNLDLLANGITVRLPIRIGGEFRDFQLNRIEVGKETRTTTRIAVAQIGIPEFPDSETEVSVPDAPTVALVSIKKAVNDAKNQGAKIVFFPELSIPHELRADMEMLARDQGIWILGGARYLVNKGERINRSVLITSEGNWFDGESKIEPAPAEAQRYPDFVSGNRIAIFDGTPVGSIAVLICFDFYEPAFLHHLRDEVDLVFVPSANPDSERLKNSVCSRSSEYGFPIVLANATGFGLSYYAAECFKSEITKKTGHDTFFESNSEKADRLFCVTIPDKETGMSYLAARPGRRRFSDSERLIPGSFDDSEGSGAARSAD